MVINGINHYPVNEKTNFAYPLDSDLSVHVSTATRNKPKLPKTANNDLLNHLPPPSEYFFIILVTMLVTYFFVNIQAKLCAL